MGQLLPVKSLLFQNGKPVFSGKEEPSIICLGLWSSKKPVASLID